MQENTKILHDNPDRIHLTVAVATTLAREEAISDAMTRQMLPHLSRCAFCRDTLRQTLRLTGASPAHGGYALIQRAAEWDSRRQAGRAAATSAQIELHAQGIGVVYQETSGQIVTELPDGTVTPFVAFSDGEAGL